MDKAYQFLVRDLGLSYKDTVVVAVSGGPDSMSLLHYINSLKHEFDLTLVCAHVNHNVRKESASEKEYLEKYCNLTGIIFESMIIEEYGEDNFHNEARSKRYRYFEEIVKKYNSAYLFTAHHADDLIETILMRIARGSTIHGYAGFSKVVDMGNYRIVRPFIEYTKEELLNYCNKNKIKFATDASNEKDVYTRNRYRKYVLPFLKSEDPNIHEKFMKFSNTLFMYDDYINKQLELVINEVYKQDTINVDNFLKLDYVLQNKLINRVLESIYQDDLMLITDAHVNLIINLIHSSKPNSYIYLPNNVKAVRSYDIVSFVFEESIANSYDVEILEHVNLPNGMNISIVDKCNDNSNFVCRFSSNDVVFPLHVRTRVIGDKMEVKGMIGRKKINDIFIDEKISTYERDLWPIVVDSTGKIVWLPGLKKSKNDRSKDEKYDIILKYY